MTRNTPEANLEARAALFAALGHPARLLIMNLVQKRPRHGEELAEILRLKPATISHHLTKLTEAGLLHPHKDQYYQTYSVVPDVLGKTLSELVFLSQPDLATDVEEDAYRKKVLSTFFKLGRLTQIPAQLKKRQIILERIAQSFEPERDYPEPAVNRILLEFHDDIAALRRGLVTEGLLQREKGIYRRVARENDQL